MALGGARGGARAVLARLVHGDGLADADVDRARRGASSRWSPGRGYLDKSWVAPFEKQTGCKVPAKYAGSSERDGQPDALGRRGPVRHGLGLRRREPPADLCRRGRRGGRQADPGVLEGVLRHVQSPPTNTVDGKH